MKKGNILLGLIGAIIGSLPGVAIYVGLTMIRVFSSWSGFVALYCAIFMYTLLSRKLTKLGVVMSILISCASMFLAEIIATSLSIANRYHYSFFTILKNFSKIYPKLSDKFYFWIYPSVACIFVVIAGCGYLFSKNTDDDVELIDEDDEIEDEDDVEHSSTDENKN